MTFTNLRIKKTILTTEELDRFSELNGVSIVNKVNIALTKKAVEKDFIFDPSDVELVKGIADDIGITEKTVTRSINELLSNDVLEVFINE